MKKIVLISLSLILVLLLGMAGCTTQPVTVTHTVEKTTLITQPAETVTKAVEILPTTVPTTTPAPGQPEYKIVTFTLEPVEPGDIGSSNPTFLSSIYLQDDQSLHLTWMVKESEDVWFHILTPSKKSLGFYENGQFANGTLEEGFCQGFPWGSTTFSPSDYDWGEGYYELLASPVSARLTIELRYWLE